MKSEIYIPAPFSPLITPGTQGPYFEMRVYTYATGQLENTAAIPAAKREVARINTELRAREIRAAEALEATK